MKPRIILYLLSFTLTYSPVNAAEGVKTIPDSAEALSMVGGRFANLADPSVTAMNPASLVDLEGTQFQFNFQFWHGETNFKQAGTGVTNSMEEPWKQTGSLYLTHQVSDDLTIAFGLNAPFGVSIVWPEDGAFRYSVPYQTTLETYALNPAFGFKLNDKVSIGAGLDIFISNLKLKQAYSWQAVTGFPFPDGNMVFNGSGTGVGAFFAVNVEPDDKQRLSFIARLPVKVDYDGDFAINNIPTVLAGGVAPISDFKSEVEYPGSLAFGYGLDLTDKTKIGFDFEWVMNSSHDDLPLDIGTNQALLGGGTALPLGWKDALSAGTGISTQITDCLTLRAGYLYSNNPMNDRNYSPGVPANDRHMFSLGAGYDFGQNTIDIGYSLIPMEDRTISGNRLGVVDGDYDYLWNIMSVSYTYRF